MLSGRHRDRAHRGGARVACRVRPDGQGQRPLLRRLDRGVQNRHHRDLGGAGARGQASLGTVVFGGMLASTLLAIPFVPVFYIIMQRVGALSLSSDQLGTSVKIPRH